jgi:hypothetical protein
MSEKGLFFHSVTFNREDEMKKSLVILCGVLLVFGVVGMSEVATLGTASGAMAATFELRDYFESLSLPYPAQSASNLWTFHNKDHNEALLPPGYSDYPVTGSIIGGLIPAGDPAWGGCGGADSYPTFDGVFVHSGFINPTVAVFHAPQSMRISEIKLWSEMVGNGLCQTPYPPANGFDVTVNSVINGVTNKIGSFIYSGPPMVEAIYTPSLILQTGDMIEILYGNNGDPRYDHGNVNVFISTNPAVTMDIKPGESPNSINPKSNGKIPVAILSTKDFDAPRQIDLNSLTFGRTGDEQSLAFCHGSEDVNRDRLQDIVCHFYTQDTGFQCHDTVGILKGETKDGTPIEGSDSVKIVPCK